MSFDLQREGRRRGRSSSPRSGSTLAKAAIPLEEMARFTDLVGSAFPFSEEGSERAGREVTERVSLEKGGLNEEGRDRKLN